MEKIHLLLNTVKIIVGAYLAIGSIVWISNLFFPLPPLEVSDFVVNKDSELIIYSNFNRTFYIYGREGKIKSRFKIPEAGGFPLLTIDANNNIYMARRRSIVAYGMNGDTKGITSATLDAPENWRLNNEGIIEHFIKPVNNEEQLFNTNRLRRIAGLGDTLFFQKKTYSGHSINDQFTDDKGYRYVCNNWITGIKVFNVNNELVLSIVPPKYLRAFVLPYPGWYIGITCMLLLVIMQFIKSQL